MFAYYSRVSEYIAAFLKKNLMIIIRKPWVNDFNLFLVPRVADSATNWNPYPRKVIDMSWRTWRKRPVMFLNAVWGNDVTYFPPLLSLSHTRNKFQSSVLRTHFFFLQFFRQTSGKGRTTVKATDTRSVSWKVSRGLKTGLMTMS